MSQYTPITETVTDKDTIRSVNRKFRKADESHLWPIYGRFNATERAIRRLRRLRRKGLALNPGYEYALALDAELTAVVNDPKL